MGWNTLNPEINYKGKHFKIGLVTIASALFGISQTPAAMILLGISAATANAIPAAVTAVVSIAAPIVGALVYVPKDSPAAPVAPAATTEAPKA
jgi:hypothetical protein